MRIHVFHTGRVRVSPYLPFGEDGCSTLKASGVLLPEAKRIWLPVSAYLIEHPAGLVLLDTGWARAMSPNGVYDAAAQRRHLGSLLFRTNQGEVGPGQTACEQLKAWGIRPQDLACVLVSHWDCDHASGLREFAAAPRVVIAREEMEKCRTASPISLVRFKRSWFAGAQLDLFDYEQTGLGPVGKSFDLFGDGVIQLVNIPGHTPGMFATVVHGEAGRYVNLVADGAYGTRSWQEMVLPGISLNKEKQRASLAWIRKSAEDPACLRVLANHDAAVQPCTIEF